MASETRFIRGHFSPCNEVDQFGLTVLHLRQEFFCLQLSLYPTYKVTKNLASLWVKDVYNKARKMFNIRTIFALN